MLSLIRKQLRRKAKKPAAGPHHYTEDKIRERWSDLALICDFRKSDAVLDMGCGEGMVALEVAPLVSRIFAVELKGNWVERARDEARRRGIANAEFQQGSALDFPVEPASFDVVLLLDVLGKTSDSGAAVGAEVLSKLLTAARRQLILRFGVHTHRERVLELGDIFALFDEHGFDGVCFPKSPKRGNVIIANRRGTDARIRMAPPTILVPADGHPCLRDAKIGTATAFDEA